MEAEQRGRVRALNDLLRRQHLGGKILLTAGVMGLGTSGVLEVLAEVAKFDTWNVANDPYDEHDFGALKVQGQSLFWKIDYFDLSMTAGAEDPSDPRTCTRTLTIMLASEY